MPVNNITVTVNNTPEVLAKIKSAIAAALDESGNLVENAAVEKCPVDTGNLRNSLTHQVNGDTVEIGTGVEYAPYVELGTSRMGKKPYLRPALENNISKIEQIFKSNFS